ncbi:hypothetical protein HELRODRAFT_178807 [Helobdella robusta]|uniref:Serine/threonine-protein kinase greatwall n=1 Tax=Helobdella robusta TaxID=6412 RepID=T1FDR6_HELRO|nr:hypothetical protein HELRODRAFT_178807 [Helobdella robusta]ESN95892.1 hypothetical protein HELRODRAFT_178807 [Helobdella robusta]
MDIGEYVVLGVIKANKCSKCHVIHATPYMKNQSLKNRLIREKKFDFEKSSFCSACALLGLQFLHQHHVVHGDLHLGNIYLDDAGYAILADFDHSTICKCQDDLTEIAAIDFKGLAGCLYEMIYGEPKALLPYHLKLKLVIYEDLSGGRSNSCYNQFEDGGIDLIKKLMSTSDVENAVENFKNHNFFKKIVWNDLIEKKHAVPKWKNLEIRYCSHYGVAINITIEYHFLYVGGGKVQTVSTNINKYAVIHMGANNKANVYKLGNTPLKNVEEEKDLGVMIHRNGKILYKESAEKVWLDLQLTKTGRKSSTDCQH